MKKLFLKSFAAVLASVIMLVSFASCDENGKITEDGFRKALTNALSNVTMEVEVDGGMNYSRTVRIVNNKSYILREDGEWEENDNAKSFVLIIGAISEHYDEFSFADGAYRAQSLHLVDAEEHYTDVSDVEITFDMSARAKSISFSEVTANGASYTYNIKLSDHGSTEQPENFASGGSSSSGIVTDGGSSGNSFGGAAEGEMSDVPSGGAGSSGNSSTDEDYVSLGAEVDIKKWISALTLEGKNYSMDVTFSSAENSASRYYRMVDGEVYSSVDRKNWSVTTVSEYFKIAELFVDRYSSFVYNGYSYVCESPDMEEYEITYAMASFDTAGKLRDFEYSIMIDGEQADASIQYYDFDTTYAPSVEENQKPSSGSEEENSENSGVSREN